MIVDDGDNDDDGAKLVAFLGSIGPVLQRRDWFGVAEAGFDIFGDGHNIPSYFYYKIIYLNILYILFISSITILSYPIPFYHIHPILIPSYNNTIPYILS